MVWSVLLCRYFVVVFGAVFQMYCCGVLALCTKRLSGCLLSWLSDVWLVLWKTPSLQCFNHMGVVCNYMQIFLLMHKLYHHCPKKFGCSYAYTMYDFQTTSDTVVSDTIYKWFKLRFAYS